MCATQTMQYYDQVIARCKIIFKKKNKDYGSSWRILRMPAFTDLLMIKTSLAISLEAKQDSASRQELQSEVVGILNYAIMALIKQKKTISERVSEQALLDSYQQVVQETRTLLAQKNEKYSEIWRKMRISSIIDIIHMKLIRIREIESNDGVTLLSEGVDAGYQDIINYAAFILILLQENTDAKAQNK